jgi:hypothetical protein
VAKTIGKDKGSLTRARRVSGAETEPVGDPSNDEPRDEDTLAAGDTTDLESDAAEAEERAAGSRDVALSARDGVVRQPATTVARGAAGMRRPGCTTTARHASSPSPSTSCSR